MGRFSLPDQRPKGLNAPVVKRAIQFMSKVHVRVFKLTNGRIGAKWRVGSAFTKPAPTLLLEHIGRKSGTTFTTPVLYLDDPPDVVIVASIGGMKKHPQWYRNLMANPETRVHLRKERGRAVRAREATDEERDRLWPKLVDMYADFAKYDGWTDRKIPVLILEPR
jgi:deazaflavin-dependent oxidoreductase (nitroreductase family)